MVTRIRVPRGGEPYPPPIGYRASGSCDSVSHRAKGNRVAEGFLFGRCPVQNYALTNEEELVLKSLAAGLKEEEIQGVLLDPADAPVGFHVESLLSKLG